MVVHEEGRTNRAGFVYGKGLTNRAGFVHEGRTIFVHEEGWTNRGAKRMVSVNDPTKTERHL